MTMKFDRIAGENVFRLEDNQGVSWDDVVRAGDSLNDVPVRVFKDRVIAGGGVLSNRELKVALETGHLVCDPAPLALAGSSIDTTIGHYFYRTGVDDHGSRSIYNPFDEAAVASYFGEVQEAEPIRDIITRLGEENIHGSTLEALKAYPVDHPGIVLAPRERILGHTQEFIGIRTPGTSSMQSRSTTGRNGWASCLCAGWGDPGYINRWTMEVYNFNDRYVIIPEGYRMAQINFFSTGPVADEYSGLTGKYQTVGSDNLTEMKRRWTPEMILPRAYKDKIAAPRSSDGLSLGTL